MSIRHHKIYNEIARDYMSNDADGLEWLEADDGRHVELEIVTRGAKVVSCGYYLREENDCNDAPVIPDTAGALDWMKKNTPAILIGLDGVWNMEEL